MNNTIIEKISKLLRLAEDNDSAGEREKALIHAQRLCAEHELSLAELDAEKWNKNVREEIKREDVELGKRQSVCQRFVNGILMQHFSVRLINSGSRYSGRSLVMIGKESDVEVAKYVQSFLNNEMMRLWQSYKRLNNAKTHERKSFLHGIYLGLGDKLKQAKSQFDTETKQQKSAEVVSNLSLMRVSDKERVDSFVSKEFPRLHKASRRYTSSGHSANAQSAGYAYGKQISLHRGLTEQSGHTIE